MLRIFVLSSFIYFTNLHNRRGGNFQCFVQLLRSNASFLWRHADTSSLPLLSDDNSSGQIMGNFSLRQRLHLLLALLKGDLDERMRHEIKWSMLFSLRIQICLLSSIEFLCFVCRNDAVQFLYLVLQSIFCKSDICFNGAVVLTCDGCLVDLW